MKFKSPFISACVLSLSLSACSILPQKDRPQAYQQNLLTKCPQHLPQLTDGKGGTVGATMNEWAKIYHRCKIRHNGLVQALDLQIRSQP